MARRRKGTGRYWVAFWLGTFLLVATAVVARQKAAFDTSGRLNRLRAERRSLESRRLELEQQIQVASSAQALLPKVARLGLSLPSDTSSTILVVGADGRPEGR
ncbi:MAG: hypothetical protein SFV24_19680 [Gemmatimonadales bacterium]|nr:hypothetical protein [Gemmatimonadota bacterium]MDX2060038.1 hypothetical protein [Gemmatimonadales bacterium]